MNQTKYIFVTGGVVSGLGMLRNKLGDAHGSGKAKVKPKERHAELAGLCE